MEKTLSINAFKELSYEDAITTEGGGGGLWDTLLKIAEVLGVVDMLNDFCKGVKDGFNETKMM